MDPFAQRMLEKAEQRSRALGISNAGNFQEFSNTETTLTNFDAARVPLTSQAQPKAPLPPPKEEQQQQQQQQLQLSSLKPTGRAETLRILEQTSPSSKPGDKRCLRKFSAYDKENKDVGIEINILTDKQVEVQVQIEDRDESDLEDAKTDEAAKEPLINQPLARIRDTSRNRLQRLGALYSNSDDLSSPIHRTEEKFHAGGDEENENKQFEGVGKPKRPFGKLAALASTINQWEDDKAAGTAQAPPKPDLPSRCVGGQEAPIKQLQAKAQAPPPPTVVEAVENHGDTRTRVLNWDPKVINSLEAQGFQRRDTSTVRLAYDYTKDPKETEPKSPPPPISPKPSRSRSREHEIPPPVVAKLASTFESTIEHNKHNSDRSRCPIKAGLVSNRAAAFEHIAAQSQQQPTVPLRDPTELTLRERMKLFERNKGEALLPKAAFGMAPSISQIRSNQEKAAITPRHGQQEKSPTTPRYGQQEKKDEAKKNETKGPASAHSSSSSISSTTTITNKPIDDLPNIRGKVAELIAIANSPSPERKIVNEVQRQRQEEMQQLANRFQKQKQLFQNRTEIQTIEKERQKDQNQKAEEHSKAIKDKLGAYTAAAGQVKKPTAPPPPAPPMQPIMKKAEDLGLLPNKRRSPAVNDSEDESKRARKVDNVRLYPALSDLDTTNTSDTDNCCTTMSARSTEDELKTNDEEDENDDSRMYTDDDNNEDTYALSKARLQTKFEGNDSEAREDSTADVCNGSFGREIMQVVQKNEHQQEQGQKQQIKEVRYASECLYYDDGNAIGGEASTSNVSFDSSMNSSAASCGLSDNLKAQAVNDGDDDHTQDSDDDYDDEGDSSRVSRGSKGTTASNSFSFRKTPGGGYNTCKTISEEEAQSMDCLDLDDDDSDSDDAMMVYQTTSLDIQQKVTVHPVKSELKVNEENDNMVTLVHTVSFYRRQQTANSANSTPVRKHLPRLGSDLTSPAVAQTSGYSTQEISDDNDDSVSRDYGGDEAGDTDLDEAELVQDKIKKLLDEVCKQQQVIAQTSQALNLCAATIEFSGSTESVEGERHLLVATHRRQACLDEVQRLRVEKSLRPVGAPREKGRLTIKEITVPLRQDYIRKLAADTISGHHLVCLLKYNEHVLATKTVPTLPGLLAVKFPDVLQLENAYADFRVTLEIYGMTAQREVLPHEVKYHINLKKCGIKTPKKKTGENRLVMPPVQSPAGPHVVRTPALVQYGFAIFSLREIQRTTWSLTQVLGVSPLDGVVHMKVNCELSVCVEHKGFLTMFEDISGFGAWHRRWCHLNGTMLNYWKYPDDEKKKAPMGSIDLYTCTTQKVALAPRDICARLNTLLLECQRPAKDSDRESLIIVPFGRTTTVRHLLSADTKEEREEWCAYFNKALTLLRAWGPPQIAS